MARLAETEILNRKVGKSGKIDPSQSNYFWSHDRIPCPHLTLKIDFGPVFSVLADLPDLTVQTSE